MRTWHDPSQRKHNRFRDLLAEGFDGEAFLRDVLGQKDIERRGDEVWCSCPLPFGAHPHGDRSASFSVNEKKMVALCFVCGGGDVLWLTQAVLDVTADQALRLVRQVSSPPSSMDAESYMTKLRSVYDSEEGATIELPRLSPSIIEQWEQPSEYLSFRGVSQEVQGRMRTGIDRRHREFRKDDGVWLEQDRIVLPHFFRGELRGWQKRKIFTAQIGPKYRSTPKHATWRRSTFYGWDQLDGYDEATVVESPLSVLVMMSDDWVNPLGVFGTFVSPSQVNLLKKFQRLTFFFDAGVAGRMATARLANALDGHVDYRAVILPKERDGWDPGDMTKQEREEWMHRSVPPAAIDRRWADAHTQDNERRDRQPSRRAGTRR